MANYREEARRAARRHGLDPNIFERQIQQESGFQPHVTSKAGARGIAQFMPGTAKGLGINPDNPTQALDGAAGLMASYVKKYGSYKNALVAYNAGPGAVGRGLPAETQGYIKTILGNKNPSTKGVSSSPVGTGSSSSRTTTVTTPGITIGAGSQTVDDPAAQKRVILANLIKQRDPESLLLKLGILDPNESTTKTVDDPGVTIPGSTVRTGTGNGQPSVPSSGGRPVTDAKGTVNFEGKQVAAWIAPELKYAREHGWKGTVTSGFRSFADQTRIYNSGVRPAAKPGTSNHEGAQFPRGAVDVSDAQTLSRILKHKKSPLVFAGAKDPVHFSHPHGGSY